MKVCFVSDVLGFGGAERVMTSLANSFVKKGIETDILVLNSNHDSSYAIDSNVNIHSLFSKRITRFKKIILLKKYLIKKQYDYVISFLPHVAIYTYLATRKTKTKFIISERSNPKSYSFLVKRLLRICFKHADGCVFQTHDAFNFYKSKSKSTIILNPIPSHLPLCDFNESKNKTIVYVASFQPIKNHKMLIDAFSIVEKTHRDYKLKLYGDGVLRNQIIEYINKKNLKSKVLLEGNNSNWYSIEKNASCFAFSSLSEGLPNALLEALCVGIPCVSTDCENGGARELITNGINGLIVKNNDLFMMADAISNIIDNKLCFDNSSLRSKCDLDNITDEWIDFLKGI